MHPKTLDRGLELVKELADLTARGDVTMAGERRKTLNDLCAFWRDGTLRYPKTIESALMDAGLRATPIRNDTKAPPTHEMLRVEADSGWGPCSPK